MVALPSARGAGGGFLVRLFMIQHGHGAFFHRSSADDWVGRVDRGTDAHAVRFLAPQTGIHHSTLGNLDRRGIGDIDTLTMHEHLARPRWGRLHCLESRRYRPAYPPPEHREWCCEDERRQRLSLSARCAGIVHSFAGDAEHRSSRGCAAYNNVIGQLN